MNKITKKNGGAPQAGFHLDKHNGKIFGVSAGIANYADIDPMLVRVGFVVGALVSFGTAELVYLAIALIAD